MCTLIESIIILMFCNEDVTCVIISHCEPEVATLGQCYSGTCSSCAVGNAGKKGNFVSVLKF